MVSFKCFKESLIERSDWSETLECGIITLVTLFAKRDILAQKFVLCNVRHTEYLPNSG